MRSVRRGELKLALETKFREKKFPQIWNHDFSEHNYIHISWSDEQYRYSSPPLSSDSVYNV